MDVSGAWMKTSIQKCMGKLKDDFDDIDSISILNASGAAKSLNGPWNLESWTNRSFLFCAFRGRFELFRTACAPLKIDKNFKINHPIQYLAKPVKNLYCGKALSALS
jgi:hypothetical protein